MKKQIAMLAVAASLIATAAFAEGVKIDGSIKSAETKTILAPYSGVVGNYAVAAGDAVNAGDALFSLRTEQVYADFDGTVTAVFAQAGDSAASVENRYGALAYIEQDMLYRAECSTTGGDSDNENKLVHVGEKVYIRSTASNDRVGEARVIGVEGKSYTLEVTSQTDMRLSENIKVYRSANHASSSCIGTGKLSRIDPQGVTATGSLTLCLMCWTAWSAATAPCICRRTACCSAFRRRAANRRPRMRCWRRIARRTRCASSAWWMSRIWPIWPWATRCR